MKVIKRVEYVEPTYKCICSKCKSELEFTRADVKSDQREGEWIVCPVCKEINTVLIGSRLVDAYLNK